MPSNSGSYRLEGKFVVFEDGTRLPTISGGFGVSAIFGITVAAVAVSVASIGVGIAEQMSQAAYEQDVANYNKKVAKNNATMAMDAAQMKSQQIRASTERQTAEGVNLLASSGADVHEGSALLYQLDQAAQTEIAARQAVYQGQVQAVGSQAQAQAFGAAGQEAMSAGVGKSLLTGVQGASSAASSAKGLFGTSPGVTD